MSDFKGRRFPTDLILLCVRWYCKFGISYRDLEEMMSERGVTVDHTTLFRWVQHYAPLMEKRIRWYQRYTDASWRADETYVKVAGQWAYLYRAIDKSGDIIDFILSPRRKRNQRGASSATRSGSVRNARPRRSTPTRTRLTARRSAPSNALANWTRPFNTGRSNISTTG
jgi:transposase-like protein